MISPALNAGCDGEFSALPTVSILTSTLVFPCSHWFRKNGLDLKRENRHLGKLYSTNPALSEVLSKYRGFGDPFVAATSVAFHLANDQP